MLLWHRLWASASSANDCGAGATTGGACLSAATDEVLDGPRLVCQCHISPAGVALKLHCGGGGHGG